MRMSKGVHLVDTHCHIQFADYPLDAAETISSAAAAGVKTLIVVGCSLPDSKAAAKLAVQFPGVWASIGLHPHEGSQYAHDNAALAEFRKLASKPKVIAVGETGLDYFYENSPKQDQKKLLRFQLEVAQKHGLPLIFHVREAFDDFFSILDDYKGVRGVVHSFSSDVADLDKILSRGLYVGLNGIMTFTKRSAQLEAAKAVPLERMLLETDAPFLTPHPFRGKICEPKHVRVTAEFLAGLRGESLEELAMVTTANARELFRI